MGETKLALVNGARIHATAVVSNRAKIGRAATVWAFAQVRERAVIGAGTMIANGVYVDAGVRIGRRVNVHNKALLYRNLVVEDDVFIGPAVCFVNDLQPRANVIRKLGSSRSTVKKGASIGAGAIILSDISIGRNAFIAAGAVVTSDVPDHALMIGVPARLKGFVSPEGKKLKFLRWDKENALLADPHSRFRLAVKKSLYETI